MEYMIVLKEKDFNEMKKLLANKPHHIGIFEQFEYYNGMYYLEITKLEFCVLLLRLKKESSRAGVTKRLYELGDMQDRNFRIYLDAVARDLATNTF